MIVETRVVFFGFTQLAWHCCSYVRLTCASANVHSVPSISVSIRVLYDVQSYIEFLVDNASLPSRFRDGFVVNRLAFV